MSYLNKVWMAASFVIVQSNVDHASKLKTGFSSAHRLHRVLPSSLRPLSSIDAFPSEDRRLPSSSTPDDSLRQVMYLNCWGQG